MPRLAQGSFIEAWQQVYRTCYGGPDIEVCRLLCGVLLHGESPSIDIDSSPKSHVCLECLQVTRYGKPQPISYRYAERLLVHDARSIGALAPDPAPHESHTHQPYPLKRIYAIGDNPASDIEGANAAHGHCCDWVSILVRTGVFQNDPGHHPANHVVDDVKAALHLIAELEGWEL